VITARDRASRGPAGADDFVEDTADSRGGDYEFLTRRTDMGRVQM
jgi:hypothetical protein